MTFQRLDHVRIRVHDLDAALDYYRGVLGLYEVGRAEGEVFLGCGGDDHPDLGLSSGGAGLDSFALTVANLDQLDQLEHHVAALPLPCERVHNHPRPGVEALTRVQLPSGHTLEAVVRTRGTGYVHPVEWQREGILAPIDLDHVTLQAADVKGLAELLRDGFGFRISDVFEVDGHWAFAWLRVGDHHHDVAIAGTEAGTKLHHVAFLGTGLADLGRYADRMARLGHRLEYGLGRHGPGGNLFMYSRDPSGNRVELCAEMARVTNPEMPTRFWRGDFLNILNVWAPLPPPSSFQEGT